MTPEQQAFEAWGEPISDRVDHQDRCTQENGGCSSPFSTSQVLCAEGQRLAEIETGRHAAWSATRRGTAVMA